MRNKIFSLIIFIFLIAGIAVLVKPQKVLLMAERREAHTRDAIHFNAELKDSLENVLRDQMPLRNMIIRKYNEYKRRVSSIFNDNKNIEIINGEIIKIDDYYALNPRQYEYNDAIIYANKETINSIDDKYDVDIYIYKPTRIEETELISLPGVYEDLEKLKNILLDGLNEDIVYKEMKIESLDDYKKMYYKTDYHLNNVGSYRAYQDIIEMISEDYDLDEVKPLIDDYIFEYPFIGYMGNIVGNEDIYDYMTDNYLAIPEDSYDYYEDGISVKMSDMKYNYLENTDVYKYNAYDVYYGFNNFERIFDFHQDDKPNILIFADSFINTIKEPLASHFNKTVILDMRSIRDDYYLDYYLKKYDIDIILVYEFYGDLYFNGDMLLREKK